MLFMLFIKIVILRFFGQNTKILLKASDILEWLLGFQTLVILSSENTRLSENTRALNFHTFRIKRCENTMILNLQNIEFTSEQNDLTYFG